MTGPVEVDNEHDAFDWVVGAAQIGATVVAGFALIYAGRGVRQARQQIAQAQAQSKAQRTIAFQERYTGREFRSIASLAVSYLDVASAADAIDKIVAWRAAAYAEEPSLLRTPRDWTAPRASKNDIVQVMGFFESLGSAFNKNELDNEAYWTTLGPVPADFLSRAWWWVCWQRDGQHLERDPTYAEFQTMVVALQKQRPEFNIEPQGRVRLLVVPARTDPWSSGWSAGRRLSRLLSDHLIDHPGRTLQALATTVESWTRGLVRSGPSELVEEVIVVSSRFDASLSAWDSFHASAERIGNALRPLDATGLERVAAELERSM